MFLCRLNPSCPFSCSTVDPPWHFSAGAHEASCHWQTGTLQLKYPEETRDQRWLFPSSLLFVLVSTSLFFQYVTFQGHWVFCCFLKSEHFVHIVHTQLLTESLNHNNLIHNFYFHWSYFWMEHRKLTMYHWQHHPCVIVKLISIGHSNIASDEIIFSICDFCECSDGDSVRPSSSPLVPHQQYHWISYWTH